jgi:putative transposase
VSAPLRGNFVFKVTQTTHQRHSLRLKGYDYSQAGAYFVTMCAQDRACLLGEIVNDGMQLNSAGEMVQRWWHELEHKFPSIELDTHAIMPNHFHGIVVITTDVGGDLRVAPAVDTHEPGQTHRSAPTKPSLPQIVQWFKTMTTNEYLRNVKQNGWPPLRGKLWQRNYHEPIIRNYEDLQRTRQYVSNNPLQWALDSENPNTHY